MNKPIDKAMHRKLQAVDAFYWTQAQQIIVSGEPLKLTGYEYQVAWFQEDHPNQTWKKASQMGVPLDVNTPIPTPTGWTTMGEIKVGDKVFGIDGEICTVTFVTPIKISSKCYEILFSDGSKITADGDHRWSVTDEKHSRYIKYKVITTQEIFETFTHKNRNRYAINISEPLNTPSVYLPVHPYIFGLWLGDGNSYSAQITAHKDDAVEYGKTFRKQIEYDDFEIRANDKRNPNVWNIKLNNLSKSFCSIGVIANKHIPVDYLRASIGQRFELLQGLMDTDGHIDKNGACRFYNSNLTLIKNVYELLMTLGLKARVRFKAMNTNWDKTGFTGNAQYEIYFRAYSETPVFKLKRKYERQLKREGNRTSETERRRIVDVKLVDNRPVRCIAVDNDDHLFLAGESMIATHNTESIAVLKSLHGLIHGKYKKGVLILMPTRDDVADYSKARFQTLITDNYESIGRHIVDTDNTYVKRIGDAIVYFRGAKASQTIGQTKSSASKLKSIPVDRIVFDEKDEMSPAMVELALYRTANSENAEFANISTPTVPNFGVDADYNKSDQRVWMIRCGHCGEHTCLELEFPNCLMPQKDGTVIRVCRKCKREIHPRDGEWVAQYPSVKDAVGWWISHLNKTTASLINPKWILEKFQDPDTKLDEFYNSCLGIAYVAAENRLTKEDVLARCGPDALYPGFYRFKTAMGVDIGKVLTVVIGYPKNKKQFKIIWIGRITDFNDLHDIAEKFNVGSAVLDMEPETRKVREFQAAENFDIYLCDYQDRLKASIKTDDTTGIVTVRRTEICDTTHEMIKQPGVLEIPRYCEEVDKFAFEVSNIVKVLEEDEISGSRRYTYRRQKGENDHYRHALNYFYLACNNSSIMYRTEEDVLKSELISRDRVEEYNPYAHL